MKQKTFLV